MIAEVFDQTDVTIKLDQGYSGPELIEHRRQHWADAAHSGIFPPRPPPSLNCHYHRSWLGVCRLVQKNGLLYAINVDHEIVWGQAVNDMAFCIFHQSRYHHYIRLNTQIGGLLGGSPTHQ